MSILGLASCLSCACNPDATPREHDLERECVPRDSIELAVEDARTSLLLGPNTAVCVMLHPSLSGKRDGAENSVDGHDMCTAGSPGSPAHLNAEGHSSVLISIGYSGTSKCFTTDHGSLSVSVSPKFGSGHERLIEFANIDRRWVVTSAISGAVY